MRRRLARVDAADVAVGTGLPLVALALGMIYLPLAPLFVGLFLLTLGLLGSLPRVR